MSYHTSEYLNSGKILVGCGKKSWWYDPRLEDANNPTHFDSFIPLATVQSRLFNFTALESSELFAKFIVDGKEILVPVKSYKAIGREDWVRDGVPETEEAGADAILAIQSEGYSPHQLQRVFIQNTADMVGGADQIGVMSAGILKWGRRAWITVSIDKELHSDAANFDYRPCLTVSTSFDGTLPTSWTRTYDFPVCDNTLDYQLMRAGESGKFTLRHTKNSAMRISDAKAAIGLLEEQADDMDRILAEMVSVEVSEKQFIEWLDIMVPIKDVKIGTKMVSIQGEQKEMQTSSTRGMTISINKRDKLTEMWDRDPRVAPWKNTKFGVLQLWNTYQHHETTVKGATALGSKMAARVEANMMRVIKQDQNSFANRDAEALKVLDTVLAEAPVAVAVKAPRARKQNAATN
jgi:phage/plasmid-like protein (TIGR03299 family)